MTGSTFDIHRHALPDAILERLASRTDAPRTWRARSGAHLLEVPGAIPWTVPREYLVPVSDEHVGIYALSTALGLEQLPAREQLAITSEWYAWATTELPRDGWWAHVPSVDLAAMLEAVDLQLGAGAAGIVLAAPRIASAAALDALGAVLARCARRSRAVFIHPGIGRPNVDTRFTPGWDAVTDYVAQQHAAWCAWQAWGRARHGDLRIAFAMGAGLAPLHADRLELRAGIETSPDPNQFFELSGIGPSAAAALAGVLAPGTLVWGSDAPVAGTTLEPMRATATAAPRRLLGADVADRLTDLRPTATHHAPLRSTA
ncbi:MAG: amidohydrolase [Thermoleophilia bacterium]|nr:amidohydrolase [Thermoleophilia bacterium]